MLLSIDNIHKSSGTTGCARCFSCCGIFATTGFLLQNKDLDKEEMFHLVSYLTLSVEACSNRAWQSGRPCPYVVHF